MKIKILITATVILIAYSIIGSGENVPLIKIEAPKHMAERNWKILRYEGYTWGSWMTHGGYCWYHVCNIDNPDIQYRVRVSSWRGELQFWYNEPERLFRANIK